MLQNWGNVTDHEIQSLRNWDSHTYIAWLGKPQAPIRSLCPWCCHPPQDAAFPHVWTIGQQHWKDTLYVRIHIQNSHLHYLHPHHHHHILILLSDLGASRSQTSLEASPTRDSSAALGIGLWLWAACSGRSEQGPQSRVWSASQKRPLASWCVTQICSSELWSWSALACLAREASLLRTILVLKSGLSDSPLHSGQLLGVWPSSQQRLRQGRQKLCPQSMVTGSRKQFMQMEQVSSLWKACSVSESMFLKIRDKWEGKRKSYSYAVIRENKAFGTVLFWTLSHFHTCLPPV